MASSEYKKTSAAISAHVPGRLEARSGMSSGLQASRERVVTQAAREASRVVPGIEPAFLMAVASKESNFNPNATNRHSSAGGLFQFTDETWMEVIRRHAAKHGHAALAQAVRLENGIPVVSADARRQIMALRHSPTFSAIMTAEMFSAERSEAEAVLGRPAREVDLYIIHAKGEGGGRAFLRAVAAGRNSQAYAGVAADLGRRRVQATALLGDIARLPVDEVAMAP